MIESIVDECARCVYPRYPGPRTIFHSKVGQFDMNFSIQKTVSNDSKEDCKFLEVR